MAPGTLLKHGRRVLRAAGSKRGGWNLLQGLLLPGCRISSCVLWELGLAVLAVSGQRTDAKLPRGSRTVLPSLHSVWGKKACLCSYFMSKQV